MASDTRITLKDNGPLLVKSPPTLTDSAGNAVNTPPAAAALCRCGLSANKPFCDGAHTNAGFSSAPDHSNLRNAAIEYSGQVQGHDITISYTPVLCSHAGECSKRARAVFDPSAKPWIRPENGTLDETLDVIAACPSGALRVRIGKQAEAHLTHGDVSIQIEKNGPYHVKNVPLEAEFNGVGASRAKYVLCRCGLSKNKPFCDGTHYDEKWRDDQA
ncbi:MAG: CDGSH iron-sulfur domain-containing protein [Burkholderiaceae bacterium]